MFHFAESSPKLALIPEEHKMGSISTSERPHAVCIPYPAQGHINPMLNLAKLLHSHGFHITFVNSDFNHRRLLKSRGPAALRGLPSFRFESIPDGLPETHVDATQDIPSLCQSTRRLCLQPFRELLGKLNSSSGAGVPPVSCIVSDGVMSFTLDAAEELGVPEVLFWTTSACGFLAYVHYRQLVQKGYTPLKDERYLSNGYLDTVIDWIPGMKDIRLKDIPTFIRTTDPEDGMIDFLLSETKRAQRASAIVLNTVTSLEREALNALSTLLPPIFSIGPLHRLVDDIVHDADLKLLGSNLWKEDTQCLDWLHHKSPNSVVYVNFGSITVMTKEQLKEFAWGLANSGQTFLWIIRPDLVAGETAVLPPEFVEATKERGMLASWCPQEKILNHPAIGGFLTHNGWNSTLESIASGVPMICWPFFAEQQTNCRYCCKHWEIGMEIDSNVERGEIERQVKELMEGKTGTHMRKKAEEWRTLLVEAAADAGSSRRNLHRLVDQVLLPRP